MKSFFGREFVTNIPGIQAMLIEESSVLTRHFDDFLLNREEGAHDLVRMFVKNFTILSSRSNRVRELINTAVNALAEQYTFDGGSVIKLKGLHDSSQADYATQWEDIVNMLKVYHHIQRNFYHIASIYKTLEPVYQALYWKKLAIKNPEMLASAFAKVITCFGDNALQEPVKSYVLGDLFRGYHDEKGRSLLDEIIEAAEQGRIKIDVILGKNNLVTIEVKEKCNDKDAMATANLDDDKVADQSPREYVEYLTQNTVRGTPDIIKIVILQYTPEQNIIFSDTADSHAKHLYYLNDNYVTVMHELGHMWSFLRGINYHPRTPIPDRLMSFHTAEEYLTTSVRPYCEDNLDPLKIKRVGHGTREFKSIAEFELEKESLIDSDVKARRQDACDTYLKSQAEKAKDAGSNVKK